MTGQMLARGITIGAALFTAVLSASPAAAIIQGDCNDNMTTAINEVQRCANIFQGIQELSTCPPCDQNGNGSVAINEVQGAANCFLDSTAAGCRMSTPGPGGPTVTPVSTNTPAPTEPGATNTVASTNTPEPTVTPVMPTDTPTATSVSPTATMAATPTATSSTGTPNTFGIAPGGGTAGNCRGTCVLGSNPGTSCNLNEECFGGGTCSPVRACQGGANNGNSCTAAANCPGGSCQPARTCAGGAYDGMLCAASTACNGCDPNRICTAAGVPLACCSGNAAGTCPLLGSCAIIQSTFPIRLALNGICLPRSYPPGDIACASNSECRTCVGGDNAGKVCRLPAHCPGGTCSAPGQCQLSEVGAEVGTEDANGERSLLLRRETLVLQPAYLSFGTACVSAGGDGVGVIDCNGGRANLNLTFRRDHNTTPGSPGNSGSAMGLPDDANCTLTSMPPDGSTQYACRERMMQCTGGTNGGQICDAADDCPGSSCGFCNIAPMGGLHANVCNSPTTVNAMGMYMPGDAGAAFPLTITLLDTLPASGVPPADFGPDGLPCTGDDLVQPGNPIPVALSTGTNSIELYDVNNTAGIRVGPGRQCGAFQCAAQVVGQGKSCASIGQGNVSGLIFGGGFPALDTPAADIATTFRFELEDQQ